MEAKATTVINRPQPAVFEYMDIPENQARVSPRLTRVETLSTLDNGGKRASYTYRLFGSQFTGTVRGVVHEPPERIQFQMYGDIEGTIEWTFEPAADGTQVTYSADYDLGLPAGLGRLLAPLVRRFNQRELETTLETLSERLE